METHFRKRETVEQLAEEFVERYRRGERPSPSEYAARYPEHAQEIRELFPALAIMEQIAPESEAAGPFSSVDSLRGRSLQHPERLGDYRVLREIGRGGMAVVYEAEQVSLGRHVALKVLPHQMLADRKRKQRFEREARAAARLHHTNIVPVFGVGEEGGLHYYVMQYIQGQALDAVLDELRRLRELEGPPGSMKPAGSGPISHSGVAVEAVVWTMLTRRDPAGDGGQPTPTPDPADVAAPVPAVPAGPAEDDSAPRAAPPAGSIAALGQTVDARRSGIQAYWRSVAHIGAQVAEALAYAHQAGVVHRDIKPANLLLDARGNVWVTDFGLAKSEDQQNLTNPGDVVGTLRYMAPERFEGHSDARCDLYALGATLYELLTLKPLFEDPSAERLIERVLHQEPVPPRKRDARIPRDLEVICLKCLSKEPAHRYGGATELADEFRRFLAGEPIRARRVSLVERGWRWCRRNKAVATLSASCALALALGFAGVTLMWRRAESNLKEADRQRTLVDRTRNDSLRQSAGLLLDRGIARAEDGDAAGGLHWMLESLRVAPADAFELRRAIRLNLAAWSEQVYGLRQIIRLDSPVVGCVFTPDGERIVIATGERLEYRDARTALPAGASIRFQSPADQVVISPDGEMLVTSHPRGGVQRWDVKTGMPIGSSLPSGGAECHLAFRPDGKAILIGCRDGTARIWDATTGGPLGAPFESRQAVLSVAYAPDGRSVLIGTGSDGRMGTASLWDVATRARLAGPFAHQDGVKAAAFNPAGSTVLTGSADGIAQLWERDTSRPAGSPLRHRHGVDQAGFTPDGATILTVSRNDVSAYLWETVTGQRVGTPLGQSDAMDCCAISPDGRMVVTGSADATARVWEVGRGWSRPLDRVEGAKGPLDLGPQDEPRLPDFYLTNTIAYSPDRKTVVTSDGGRIARLWETSTGRPLGAPLRHGRDVRTVAFSPDGRLVATASHEPASGLMDSSLGCIRIWDAGTGRPLGPPIWQTQWVSALAFSPDSRVLASGDYGQLVRFWDTTTGRPVGAPIAQRGIVFYLAYSPDGKKLAVATVMPVCEARLWDLATGRPIGNGMPHKNWVVGVAFSPDGRALLTRSHDSTARLWDAQTALPLTEPMQHLGAPVVAFSPDGQRLASAGGLETEVKIRDAGTGRPMPGAAMGHGSLVTALAFSPDGRQLGVGCKDGSARLWDVATARPLGPALVQRSPVAVVTFTPDGRNLLSTAADGTTRSWHVPAPLEGDLDRLALRLQVLTGMQMDASQHVEKLAAGTWEERSLRLKELEGTVAGAYATSVSPSAYHDARARDAEQDGNTFAARWHLDRLIDRRRMSAYDDEDVPVRWLLHARRARACSTAGQLDAADADYRRALDLSSQAMMVDWYRHRVADCEQRSQWRTALWYLDRCLAAQPKSGELYAIRARVLGRLNRPEDHLADLTRAGELGAEGETLIALADEHAALGRWARAASLYAEATRRGPLPPPACVRGALVYLEVGDRAGYRALCRAMLEGRSKAETPEEADFIVKTCTLGPEATDDLQLAVDLAGFAVERGASFARPDFLCTLGAILYRAGRAADAMVRLEEALATKDGRKATRALLFLAMAQHRLGRTGLAEQTFHEANRRVGGQGAEHHPTSWPDRLEYQVLRREAETLILGPRRHGADRPEANRPPGR
jgi:WD40 repeat protein/tRNA A-37 threonylcarbamoyl transferase component Bud32/tetratricopeptide (TPR) repeat protein